MTRRRTWWWLMNAVGGGGDGRKVTHTQTQTQTIHNLFSLSSTSRKINTWFTHVNSFYFEYFFSSCPLFVCFTTKKKFLFLFYSHFILWLTSIGCNDLNTNSFFIHFFAGWCFAGACVCAYWIRKQYLLFFDQIELETHFTFLLWYKYFCCCCCWWCAYVRATTHYLNKNHHNDSEPKKNTTTTTNQQQLL